VVNALENLAVIWVLVIVFSDGLFGETLKIQNERKYCFFVVEKW
jgi:hypothetical protein